MSVAVYATNGTLISKQTRNISPVFGQTLNIPSMTLTNIKDPNVQVCVY